MFARSERPSRPWLLCLADLASHDLFDRVVVESAAHQVRVDLPSLLRVRHVRPAREGPRQGAARKLDVQDVIRDWLGGLDWSAKVRMLW